MNWVNSLPFLVSSSQNGWSLTPLALEYETNSNSSLENTYIPYNQRVQTLFNALVQASTLQGFFDATTTFIHSIKQTTYQNIHITPRHLANSEEIIRRKILWGFFAFVLRSCIESLKYSLEILVHLHDRSDISAAIAIVRRWPHVH